VSTAIDDVVEPYGRLGLVAIASSAEATVRAVEAVLAGRVPDPTTVDSFLARGSWDRTWAEMEARVEEVVRQRSRRTLLGASRPAVRVPSIREARVSLPARTTGAEALGRAPAAAGTPSRAD
jgi:hypothetical protein